MYFDNAATTKPFAEVLSLYNKIAEENYFNAQATYSGGLASNKILQAEREKVAYIVNATESEIYFTSGGTECNNIAIFGGAKNKSGRIISTKIEHPSVLNCMQSLKSSGYDVQFVDILPSGQIDQKHFESLLSENVSLVSIMHANNETGEINDIRTLCQLTKKANPNALFHSDGVQAFAKLNVNVKDLGVDFYSMSPHKFGGVKGAGVLFVKKGTNPRPHIFGGGQEKNLRSGTENLPAIATICTAYNIFCSKKEEFFANCKYFENKLFSALAEAKIDYKRNGTNMMNHIFNLSFAGQKAEILMQKLSVLDIFVSKGSACSSRVKTSNLAIALNLPKNYAEGTIRISLGVQNTKQEIDYFVEKLVELLR